MLKNILIKRGFIVKHQHHRKFIGGALYNKEKKIADVKHGQIKQTRIINVSPNKNKRLNLKL
jgi:hypothetical protein